MRGLSLPIALLIAALLLVGCYQPHPDAVLVDERARTGWYIDGISMRCATAHADGGFSPLSTCASMNVSAFRTSSSP